MVKSPISRPASLSMGDSTMRPIAGTRFAMTLPSHSAAFGPVTSNLP